MARESVSHRENDSEAAEPLLASTDIPAKSSGRQPSHQTRCTWPWIYVVVGCVTLAVVSEIGEYLYTAPRVRLFESVSCNRYYLQYDPSLVNPDGSVPEALCKVDPVQNEVASVLGWQLFFDSIPAILLPLPFGYLADKYGRKWILVSAMVGYTLTWISTLSFIGVLHWPLQSVWFSSLFLLIGGGAAIATTMVTTIVADVVPPELRSTVFFYRFCAELIAECFVPPFTFILMQKGIWTPLLVAVGFQILATAGALVLPETLPVASSETIDDLSTDPPRVPIAPPLHDPISSGKQTNWFQRIKESYAFVTRDAAVASLVFTFLISKVGRLANNVLFQYVSKRYGWSLSQAGLLLSLRAGVNIILFTVILPIVINFVLASTNAALRDLRIGQVSIVLMLVGVIIMALSGSVSLLITGLVVYTLGTGFPPIIRSLVTFLVESHHESKTSDVARLYALISVTEGIGSLLAGPGMAWAFQWGMSLGERWLGLPYGLASMLFALALAIVFTIKPN